MSPCRVSAHLLLLAERYGVPCWIGDCGDSLIPRHVLWFPKNCRARLYELRERGGEIIDIDVHLEPCAVSERQAVSVAGPPRLGDRKLAGAVLSQADVSRLAFCWELEMSPEPQTLPEPRLGLDILGIDDGKGSQRHERRVTTGKPSPTAELGSRRTFSGPRIRASSVRSCLRLFPVSTARPVPASSASPLCARRCDCWRFPALSHLSLRPGTPSVSFKTQTCLVSYGSLSARCCGSSDRSCSGVRRRRRACRPGRTR